MFLYYRGYGSTLEHIKDVMTQRCDYNFVLTERFKNAILYNITIKYTNILQ